MSAYDLSIKKVAETSEIPIGKMKVVKMKEKDILVANVNGNFYAIDNHCTHEGGNLSKGSLDGNIVTCPLHGSKFDVTTGKDLSKPKSWFQTHKTIDTKTYEVKVKGNDILVYQRSSWGV
ncbi:non-heme iron oxygenase ferredoxin subunit [Candidatus Bathyarchaeota archaeon]|nr:non-heme iron oxygenase ferredoxin subunit [Candidatus Bathyarchaeota archaeon]